MDDVGKPWVLPLGLTVVTLVVAATAAGAVGLGTSGPAGVATVAVLLYATAAMAFLWGQGPAAVTVTLLSLMALSAAALHAADPSGPVVGLFLVTALAPLRLAERAALAVALLAVLAFDIALALTQPRPLVSVAVVSVGAGFFFLFGLLLRREHDQRRRADGLLAELVASRAAERESAALAERARVAREIHDVLAHTLSGLVVQLDGARLLAAGADTAPRLRTLVTDSHRLARDGLVEARQAVAALRGTPGPGPELLVDLVDEHRRLTGDACTLTVHGRPRALRPEARLAVYRVAQEALSNVRKHARGAAASLDLTWREEDVELRVRNTPGAPTLDGVPGHGLTGMSERAALVGGQLEVCPGGPGGFEVRLTLPAPRGEAG